MLDILIKNGYVVDGTGRQAFKADVGIEKGRVVVVAESVELDARRTIYALGLHISPGFIDPHTHSDLTLLVDPRAESKVRQGVTTEIVGNCGSSPAPLPGGVTVETRNWAASLGVDVTWASVAEYLDRLRQPGIALNVVPLVGHNAVRESVMGVSNVQPTVEQQTAMEQLLAEAMDQGARGVSTGFFFPPGCYASTEEVIGLARVAARYGGVYASHIRSYDEGLLAAAAEAIEIGERTGVQVEIAHIKLTGYQNWDGADYLLAMLDDAKSRGVRVGCDQYPYAVSAMPLAAVFPDWAQVGGAETIGERLSDPDERRRLRWDWEENRTAWQKRSAVRGWDDILVACCAPRPDVVGKSIRSIADAEHMDPLDVLLDLILISAGQAVGVFQDQCEQNVRALLRHPSVVVGSDGSALTPHGVLGQQKLNPRAYGTFPRVLGRYVHTDKVLSLESAVRKMTSLTAQRFGLADRGVIRKGAWADLVVFDADSIIDKATFTDPHRYSEGIHYVLVNGVAVVDRGHHTGALPGRVL